MEWFIFLLVIYIFLGLGGGVIVFGLYYLLYKLMIKKEGVIASLSLVMIIAFVMGCVNTLLGIVLCISSYLDEMVIPLIDNILEPTGSSDPILFLIFFPFFMIIVCYSIFTIPVSLASIAFSFIEREKKLITGKRFVLVALINIASFVLVLLFFYIAASHIPGF